MANGIDVQTLKPKSRRIDINTTDFPPLSHPQIITAPTVGMTPTSGDYYGANGYQMGIDIYGKNIAVKDGIHQILQQ